MKRQGRSRGGSTAGDPSQWRRENFPSLSGFLSGYLHEDFQAIHGSARAAAEAYCADASPEERRQLLEELTTLSLLAADRPVRDLRRFLAKDLGSRWELTSRDHLEELVAAIRAAL